MSTTNATVTIEIVRKDDLTWSVQRIELAGEVVQSPEPPTPESVLMIGPFQGTTFVSIPYLINEITKGVSQGWPQ